MPLIVNPTCSSCSCYAFAGRQRVVRKDGQPMEFADLQLVAEACGVEEWVEEQACDVCALSLTDVSHLPMEYELQLVRLHFHESEADEVLRTSRAKALTGWLSNAHFCSHCGSPMRPDLELSAMDCPNCGRQVFPRIEPCIIVLVYRGREILLARHVQRNQDIYACIAGFMEAGETAEQAVAREVYEETQLRIKNIRYFGSQSWPFPAQLMLGFTAEYESGEIHEQREEIQRAAWFDPLHCPASPAPGSIAYELIRDARERMEGK